MASDQPSNGSSGDPGYAEAIAELEAILESLEGEEVDIDRLASDVRRAAELIRLCRARIAGARLEIEQIVDDLDEAAAEPIASSESDDA